MSAVVLILVFVTNTPRVVTEHIPFQTMAACEAALNGIKGSGVRTTEYLRYARCLPTGAP